MKCAKCGLQLTGTFTVFNEQKYHTKCFVCCQCGQEFSDKSFFKLDGQPLCRTCHSKNLVEQASRCKKCSQPILDTVVTFKNSEYHDYCLVCTECDKKVRKKQIKPIFKTIFLLINRRSKNPIIWNFIYLNSFMIFNSW